MYQVRLLVFERCQVMTHDVCAIKWNCLHDEHVLRKEENCLSSWSATSLSCYRHFFLKWVLRWLNEHNALFKEISLVISVQRSASHKICLPLIACAEEKMKTCKEKTQPNIWLFWVYAKYATSRDTCLFYIWVLFIYLGTEKHYMTLAT